jgi:plasmid maintenance system antidote protein VapI
LVASQKGSIEEEAELQQSLSAALLKLNRVKLEKIKQYKSDISKATAIGLKEREKMGKELGLEAERLER